MDRMTERRWRCGYGTRRVQTFERINATNGPGTSPDRDILAQQPISEKIPFVLENATHAYVRVFEGMLGFVNPGEARKRFETVIDWPAAPSVERVFHT